MAPRKRTSSGGKKTNLQNREAQQPMQPSKFGIEHFFERHSQSQKTYCQRSSSKNQVSDFANASDENPPTVPEPVRKRASDEDCVEIGAGNPQGKTKIENTEPMDKYLRGESPICGALMPTTGDASADRNELSVLPLAKVNVGSTGRDSSAAVADLVLEKDETLRDSEASNPSHDTSSNRSSSVNFDVEEKQLEVTPEICKSGSVKRFKFSPGMLIKLSQDDVIDEVTWKISPVNEKLRTMSKHLKGGIRVLTDSTRFNTVNLQQCSVNKTSSGISGKPGKWLSSPPLAPDKASLSCSDRLETGNSNLGDDICCHGSSGNKTRNIIAEAMNTQSPFSTPPSLSICPDKVVEDMNSNGRPDHGGSRHHKKALIELLDQVEDVISVEQPICKDNQTFLDSEQHPKPFVVNNPEKNKHFKYSNSIFLVLEVSEKHGTAKSSCGQSSFKVLRLLNEESGAERALQLWDEWYYSVVAPGDSVHVIGEFDEVGKCDVNRQKNFIIVHPEILVSGTRVSASFSCPRRTVLDDRLKQNEQSVAALTGTLLHQIFQAGLISESPTKEFLEVYARTAFHKCLESLYACGGDENDIWKTLIDAIPKILNWISSFRDSQNSESPSIDFKFDGLKKIKVSEVIDIEEMAWAPKYGLKGMIDASVKVRTSTNSAETSELIMPLEFKTGKGTSGLTAMEHSAQVMLYTLLMSERYMTNIDQGLLYYLHTDQTHGISVRRSDLVGLIMRRNDLADDLLKALRTQQLPPMLQSPTMCRNCRHLSACTIYDKAYGGNAEGSGLGDIYEQLVSHLTNVHTTFLKKWEKLIDLEAEHMEVVKKEFQCSDNAKNDEHSVGLSSLILDASDKSTKRFCRDSRFVYRFVKERPLLDKEQTDGESLSSTSSLDSRFRNGDYVILSTEAGHLQVAKGVIMDISNSHVCVSVAKRLRLPGNSPCSTADLHKQSWRIDKDEIMTSFAVMRYNLIQLFFQTDHSSHLRKMIVDLEMPRFDSGNVFSQDPAISYIWSETSLNDDQRRAILKILTTKNYALVLGMPGTGKTSTMVHAVKALLMRGASILLTSYTNSAVDNLLIKLKAQGIDFIRIGRYEAVHEEIQEKCLSAMNLGSTKEIKEKLDGIKVVAVTCLGINSPLLTDKKFDICIMDEAGQLTLPVSLGPLMLASKFVLVGDHYQLPPLVQSPEAKEKGMSLSLFCRLSEAHPQAIAALHCQYRMCAAIMELSNALIYGNRLRCGSEEIANAALKYRHTAPTPAWLAEVLNPDHPVIFINTDLLPAYDNSNNRKGINNPIEAYIVSEVVKALVLRGIEGIDIGIITPYNSQANLIRGAVSPPVEINTIDKYQGRDKDCILLSFVRSNENPRNNTSSSLLGDWHRINVALTRAKKKLIMVGSCRTLATVPLLKLLIQKVEELSGVLTVSSKEINCQPQLKRCSQLG